MVLNIAEANCRAQGAFKELAKHMRGKVKLLFRAQEEDAVMIDGFESLLNVARLTFVTSNWPLRTFCTIWVSHFP